MQYISLITRASSYNQYAQLSGILSRGMYLIASISGIIIALLWIPIAIGFFSTDENRKFAAYSRAKSAALGTFIFILAVTGAIYGAFNFIVTGN